MAVTYHVGNIIRGTTAERTGGTWTNLPAGWIYIESDGLAIYRWSGSVWASITGGAPITPSYVTLANDATLTGERVLTAGDGISLVDGGANTTATMTYDVLNLARRRVSFIEECLCDGCSNYFVTAFSGVGAALNMVSVGGLQEFGVWELTTGTTTTGKAAIQTGSLSSFSLGQGVARLEMNIKIPTLSTAAEEFVLRIGFLDSITGGSTDGAYFIYDRLNSVNWRINTNSNSANTTTNSTTAVGTGWVRLLINVNAAGTSVSFSVNGTEVSGSPITTTIPVGVGRETAIVASIIKSAGTTARGAYIDYIAFDYDLTTLR